MRNVDGVVARCSTHKDRIKTGPTVDRVVTSTADECVFTIVAVELIVACSAKQSVVASTTGHDNVSGSRGGCCIELIIAFISVKCQSDNGIGSGTDDDAIIAFVTIDGQRIDRLSARYIHVVT